MTCVVVNDASCLIDLKKGALLHVLLRLPYQFIVPLPIREEELLDFTAQEWRMLEDGGLATYDLPSEEVARVFALKREHSRLSSNDCFALVTTTCQENGILPDRRQPAAQGGHRPRCARSRCSLDHRRAACCRSL